MENAQYPTAAELACKFLPVQVTSASPERIFSAAGNTITAKRNRLSCEKLRNRVPARVRKVRPVVIRARRQEHPVSVKRQDFA